MLSIFDIYKISMGPSSSHTMGPMLAANRFMAELELDDTIKNVTAIKVHLYGSLSLTGRGHLTDQAVMLGLEMNSPESIQIDKVDSTIKRIKRNKKLTIKTDSYTKKISFPHNAIEFHDQNLPLHENGLKFEAFVNDRKILSKVY